MNIDNTAFTTNLGQASTILRLCLLNLCVHENYIQQLKDTITRNIDCLEVKYDNATFTFYIKIKKTSMRKRNDFAHDPIFYYSIIQNIFQEFIYCNESTIISLIENEFNKDSTDIKQLINNRVAALPNICHVSCISDNIVVIKL